MTAKTTKRPEQIPLEFSHEAATGRDDLAVSEPVSAAAAIIDRWPAWPSAVVVITGPEGAGKSHLARVWAERSAARPITLARDGDCVLDAEAGPVLFEDADRAGFDETALFHVINAVRAHANHLLITSREHPSSWNVSLADLKSRLKAATIVEIGPPDEELLTQVIHKLFADRQIMIDDRLASYMVSRMERSFSAANALVDGMDKLALARGTKVSRALAAEVLSSLEKDS